MCCISLSARAIICTFHLIRLRAKKSQCDKKSGYEYDVTWLCLNHNRNHYTTQYDVTWLCLNHNHNHCTTQHTHHTHYKLQKHTHFELSLSLSHFYTCRKHNYILLNDSHRPFTSYICV